jgi:hypothetical protein
MITLVPTGAIEVVIATDVLEGRDSLSVRAPHQIERQFDLRYDRVPFIEREVGVGCVECCQKVILERSDIPFHWIGPVVVWRHSFFKVVGDFVVHPCFKGAS